MAPTLITVGDNGESHGPKPLQDEANWTLTLVIAGVRTVYALSELKSMGEADHALEVECVSSGFIAGRGQEVQFRGIRLSQLLERHVVPSNIQSVVFRSKAPAAVGPEPHHVTSLELDYCLGPSLLLAWGINGEPLPYRNGWPLRSVVGPDRYFYKAIKWLDEIELTSLPLVDCPGTWEQFGGYHPVGRTGQDPEERFSCVMRLMIDPVARQSEGLPAASYREHFESLMTAGDLSRLIIAKADQLGVTKNRDFRAIRFVDGPFRAQIRGTLFMDCDFRNVNLKGVNLSLCQFTRCAFDHADLSECDLEGAKIWGLNLEGVSFRDAVLTNCSFYPPAFLSKGKKTKPAQVAGADFRGARNIDPQQAAWLKEDGALLD